MCAQVQKETLQTGFKPVHRRTGSDVIDCLGEDPVFQDGKNQTSNNRRSFNMSTDELTRRKSTGNVDCGSVENGKLSTEVDGPAIRPTTLETKMDQKQRTKEWKKSKSSSRDLLDATPTTTPERTGINVDNTSGGYTTEADMPVDLDADEYNMQHQNRGHAVILNHDKFDGKYPPREGSEHDVKSLHTAFSSLGFAVTVHNNPDFCEIKQIISKLAQEDHSDNDCLVVVVLTHGEKGGYLLPREGTVAYTVDMLWEPFTSDKCPTLAGKPKLFFIQACRGSKVDAGTLMRRNYVRRDEYDSCPSSYSIPTRADFLIAYSTVEDFYSFRNPDTGTWFIQCLCRELNITDNLLQILTKTTRRVAQLESNSDITETNKRKQVPSITSMLTRDLYFRPKH